jgi:PPP family 3-phenylpropionic acid transporter
MSSSSQRRFSAEARASVFQFFALTTAGVATAYFGVWLKGRGLSAGDVGIVNAAPVLALMLINIFVGRLADRASDWRQMIITLAVVAAVIPLGFYAVSGVVGYAIVWTLFMIPAGSLPPVLDAASLRLTERNGTSFGKIRGWGTLGSMVATATTGLIVGWLGAWTFVPLLLLYSVLRAALAFQLPRFRAPDRVAMLPRANAAGKLRDVMKPWFVLPIVAFALVQATHFIISGFAALVWKEQGIPDGILGILLATSQASEAAIMFVWRRIGARVSARQMILASCLVTVLRWAIVAMAPPLPILFLTQALHSVTFAIGYLGTVHFIANWTSEDIAAEAQSFSFVVQQGVAVVALILFGWLLGLFGTGAFYVASFMGLIGALCVVASLVLKPPRETALQANPA